VRARQALTLAERERTARAEVRDVALVRCRFLLLRLGLLLDVT
jgi:hypothetical protein